MGRSDLSPSEAHHARDVLRLAAGTCVELFDDAGNLATAMIDRINGDGVTLLVESIQPPQTESTSITIASALPKRERADWMIEKLSELGVSRFIPLETARSVVHPTGKNKSERWLRIAKESAKQSRRSGVMQIDPLTPLDRVAEQGSGHFFLSTDGKAAPIVPTLHSAIRNPHSAFTFLIGPEGGWTDAELTLFRERGLTGLKLTATILRVETAAVAATAIAAAMSSAIDVNDKGSSNSP